MSRNALKTPFAAILISAPVAAQEATRPDPFSWLPADVMPTAPAVKAESRPISSATKIGPFDSKFIDRHYSSPGWCQLELCLVKPPVLPPTVVPHRSAADGR